MTRTSTTSDREPLRSSDAADGYAAVFEAMAQRLAEGEFDGLGAAEAAEAPVAADD